MEPRFWLQVQLNRTVHKPIERFLAPYVDAHGAVRFRWHSHGVVRCFAISNGAVRCGFQKSKDLRCGSVRFSEIVKPTVRFGAVFRCREPYCAVRCYFVLRSGSVSDIDKPAVRCGAVRCGAVFKEANMRRCGAVNPTEPYQTDRKNRTVKNLLLIYKTTSSENRDIYYVEVIV